MISTITSDRNSTMVNYENGCDICLNTVLANFEKRSLKS